MTAHPDCAQCAQCLLYGWTPEACKEADRDAVACTEARRKEERLREADIYSVYGQPMTSGPKNV